MDLKEPLALDDEPIALPDAGDFSAEEWEDIERYGRWRVPERLRFGAKQKALEKALRYLEIFIRTKEFAVQFKEDSDLPDHGIFLKLKDKETVKGIFRGEICDFNQHWLKGKSEVCKGEGCALCRENKPSFRFKVNFVMRDSAGNFTPKIFEQGKTVYVQLRDLQKAGYPLNKTILQITRTGMDRETTYSILPMPAPHGQVNEKLEALLQALTLHPLQKVDSPQEEEAVPSLAALDDIPF